jgi:hypothetical protein
MKKSEKRSAPRYQGKLPVKLKGAKGITRDFSSTGIFFETNQSFSLGQPIEFAIELQYAHFEGPFQVKCKGQIVRVEESGEKIGVAATIDSYSFVFKEMPNDQS